MLFFDDQLQILHWEYLHYIYSESWRPEDKRQWFEEMVFLWSFHYLNCIWRNLYCCAAKTSKKTPKQSVNILLELFPDWPLFVWGKKNCISMNTFGLSSPKWLDLPIVLHKKFNFSRRPVLKEDSQLHILLLTLYRWSCNFWKAWVAPYMSHVV